MNGHFSVTRIIVLLTCLACDCVASGLSTNEKSVNVPFNFSGHTLPRWQNGYFIAAEVDTGTIVVHSSDGSLKARAKISVPDARTAIYGVAASSDGKFAANGTAFGVAGQVASFIAWLNEKGVVERLVRTSPFGTMAVCFDSDGTLWALGREYNRESMEVPGHAILRRYSPDGKLLQTALSIDTFRGHKKDRDPHPATNGHMIATQGGVGFYSEVANEYVEVSASGAVTGRWGGIQQAAAKVMVTGIARTGNGATYISTQEKNQLQGQENTAVYRLDKRTGEWSKIENTAKNSRLVLYGADGGELVLQGTSAGSLVWMRDRENP